MIGFLSVGGSDRCADTTSATESRCLLCCPDSSPGWPPRYDVNSVSAVDSVDSEPDAERCLSPSARKPPDRSGSNLPVRTSEIPPSPRSRSFNRPPYQRVSLVSLTIRHPTHIRPIAPPPGSTDDPQGLPLRGQNRSRLPCKPTTTGKHGRQPENALGTVSRTKGFRPSLEGPRHRETWSNNLLV